MSAFEEFQGMADRSLATLGDAYALIEQARRVAEESAAQYRTLANESNAATLHSAAEQAEHVPTTLDQATGAMIAGVAEFDGYLTQIGARASGGVGGGSGGAQVGDKAPAPESSPGELEKEHASTEDGAPGMKRRARFSNALVRNAEDIQSQINTWSQSAMSTKPTLEPPPGQTYAIVGHHTHPEIGPVGHDSFTDPFGHLALVATAVGSIIARRRREKREKDG